MANDKLKHEDDTLGSPSLLQWFEEIEKNEAANFKGTANNSNAVGADDITMPGSMMPFSLFPGAEGTSNPYAKDMLLTGFNLMTDLTPFNYSLNPILDYGSVYGKNHIPILPSTDSNFLCLEGNTDFGQYDTLGYSVPPVYVVNASSEVGVLQKPYVDRELVTATGSATALNCLQQDGELNSSTSRPQFIRSFISDGGSTPMSCPTLDDVELAINNNLLLSEVQEDHPEKLDGSCLTLGIGRKSKDLSESNILGRNIAYNSERDVLPQSNIFHSRQANGSSFNTFPGIAAGFSCFQNNMPQVDKQHQFLVPRNRNVCRGVEGNWDERFAYFDPNNGFQGYPVGSSLARLPDPGLSKVNELPLSCSLNTSTCLPLSDQLQKHHVETYANLFSDSSEVFPPVVGTRNTSLHNQSGKPFTANEGMTVPVAERGLFPEEFSFSQLASNCYQPQVISAVLSSTNILGSVMTGKEIPATKVNRAVQPSRAFVDTSVKRGAAETSAGTSQALPTFSGEEITATKVDKTAQCLRAFVGTSVKRGTAETSPATSQAEHRKARRTQSSTGPTAKAPFLDVSSLQSLGPTSPSFLLQAKSTTLIQPLSQTRSPLPSEIKGLPSLSQTSPSLPPQAKSTPIFQSLFQTTSSLPLQVKGIPSLPSLFHTTPSIQPQAKSIPSFLPTTSSTPIKTRRNELLPPQSQTAHSLPPQAKTTTSLPLPSLAVASLPPITNTTSPPTLYQNAPSCTPQPQTASPFPLQQTTGRPLPPKSLAGSPLPQKSQTALPLPSKSHTASSLSPKFIAPPLLPPQPQTASPIPPKSIAPPRTRPPQTAKPQTTSPLPPKVNAPPLPSQPQTDSVVHIKWKGADQTELTGHKCLICKRDLAFTPEGPVSVPSIAPVVAVLPCGHTFHDHCLQLITAEDEVKSPPCIPCAIGEN